MTSTVVYSETHLSDNQQYFKGPFNGMANSVKVHLNSQVTTLLAKRARFISIKFKLLSLS